MYLLLYYVPSYLYVPTCLHSCYDKYLTRRCKMLRTQVTMKEVWFNMTIKSQNSVNILVDHNRLLGILQLQFLVISCYVGDDSCVVCTYVYLPIQVMCSTYCVEESVPCSYKTSNNILLFLILYKGNRYLPNILDRDL